MAHINPAMLYILDYCNAPIDPTVRKNIRDFFIMYETENGRPYHFSEYEAAPTSLPGKIVVWLNAVLYKDASQQISLYQLANLLTMTQHSDPYIATLAMEIINKFYDRDKAEPIELDTIREHIVKHHASMVNTCWAWRTMVSTYYVPRSINDIVNAAEKVATVTRNMTFDCVCFLSALRSIMLFKIDDALNWKLMAVLDLVVKDKVDDIEAVPRIYHMATRKSWHEYTIPWNDPARMYILSFLWALYCFLRYPNDTNKCIALSQLSNDETSTLIASKLSFARCGRSRVKSK